ncbi:MAG: hypothetical protein KAQ83_03310 [Nanoarchaeota archaeon]|nr:hypothetical protein [Nanoarchaeota archaeon]
MQVVESKEELWKIIAQLRILGQKDTYPGQPRVELGELERWVSREGIAHDWTNSHFKLNYQGQYIDVQIPKKVAYREIIILRPIGEILFNNAFVVFEELESSVGREIEQYKHLRKKGLPTFKPREDLLKTKDGDLIFYDVLITDWVEGDNVAELIKTATPEETRKYLQEGAQFTRQVHNGNSIWGDANLQNMNETLDGVFMGYDWGYKTNPCRTQLFLMAKDLTNLILTSKSHANHKEKIEEIIIDSYDPSSQLRRELKKQINRDLRRKHNPLYKLYNNPAYNFLESKFFRFVYEATSEEVIETKTTIYDLVA